MQRKPARRTWGPASSIRDDSSPIACEREESTRFEFSFATPEGPRAMRVRGGEVAANSRGHSHARSRRDVKHGNSEPGHLDHRVDPVDALLDATGRKGGKHPPPRRRPATHRRSPRPGVRGRRASAAGRRGRSRGRRCRRQRPRRATRDRRVQAAAVRRPQSEGGRVPQGLPRRPDGRHADQPRGPGAPQPAHRGGPRPRLRRRDPGPGLPGRHPSRPPGRVPGRVWVASSTGRGSGGADGSAPAPGAGGSARATGGTCRRSP